MKWQQLLLSAVLLVWCSGCLWPFTSAKPVSLTTTPTAIQVEVLRPDLLAKYGKLAFIPFAAGVDAEAGPQLDHLALVMVKGASDMLKDSSSSIQMIDQGDPDTADMVLDGHIEDFHASGGWTTMGPGKKAGVLVIKAEVRDRRTNEILALISGRKEFRIAKEAEALAYSIGSEIAGQLIQPKSRP
jgi:hypothetical protein